MPIANYGSTSFDQVADADGTVVGASMFAGYSANEHSGAVAGRRRPQRRDRHRADAHLGRAGRRHQEDHRPAAPAEAGARHRQPRPLRQDRPPGVRRRLAHRGGLLNRPPRAGAPIRRAGPRRAGRALRIGACPKSCQRGPARSSRPPSGSPRALVAGHPPTAAPAGTRRYGAPKPRRQPTQQVAAVAEQVRLAVEAIRSPHRRADGARRGARSRARRRRTPGRRRRRRRPRHRRRGACPSRRHRRCPAVPDPRDAPRLLAVELAAAGVHRADVDRPPARALRLHLHARAAGRDLRRRLVARAPGCPPGGVAESLIGGGSALRRRRACGRWRAACG